MEFHIEKIDLIKLLISCFTGAVIGFEREYRSKSVGLRTIILITIGSTLFTIISIKVGNDPARIAANIVTGIGFIGGGIIFRDNSIGKITGITTAATVWVSAALGMCAGIGNGLYGTGFIAMILVVITLYTLMSVENKIKKSNLSREYKLVFEYEVKSLKQIEQKFLKHNLSYKRGVQSKQQNKITGTWTIQGPESKHESLVKSLLEDKEILEMIF
jgi:putative Mg2+ transporter-C (MgtC) family protein